MITVIANWPVARIDHWVALLRARAIENQAYVAGVNRCGTDPKLAYTGHSMIESHKGMNIKDAEFTALVEDLVKSLDKFKVRAQEKNELLTALGGMKPQIVGR